jgi:hypothetical protein
MPREQQLNLSPTRLAGTTGDGLRLTPPEAEKVEDLLRRGEQWFLDREDFRKRRARSRDYRFGKQWQQSVTVDGERKTEKEHIKDQGRIPWVINQIGSVARNLKGQYRQNTSERAVFAVDREDQDATEMVNIKRRGTRRYNRATAVEADQFEEHVMSGASGFKVTIDWDGDLERQEVMIDPIDQTRIFYNRDLEDRRARNLRLIGELHDLTFEELVATYAVSEDGTLSRTKAERIQDLYGHLDDDFVPGFAGGTANGTDPVDFYSTHDPSMARVIEIWTKRRKLTRYAVDPATGRRQQLPDRASPESLQRLNDRRRSQGQAPLQTETRIEDTWVTRHLTPEGHILWEQETPYWHGEHPYVLCLATLVDGRTWGLIENIIDPQRWLNRLVTMIDHGLGVGAKGVLLVPEDSIPDELSIDDFAEEWSRQGGVLKIKTKPNSEIPQEVRTNSIEPGSFELLQQLKAWIEETSGVTGAQRGEEPPSGTPAALFQQQIIQSGLTNLDYFESFFEGTRELDYKTVQCIQQAIDRPLEMTEGPAQGAVTYRPEDARQLKFDVSVGSVRDTATFRQVFEEDLQQFLSAGFIDFGTYLQLSAHPKAETLLRVLQQRDPEMLSLGTTEMQAASAAISGGAPPKDSGGAGAASPSLSLPQ